MLLYADIPPKQQLCVNQGLKLGIEHQGVICIQTADAKNLLLTNLFFNFDKFSTPDSHLCVTTRPELVGVLESLPELRV